MPSFSKEELGIFIKEHMEIIKSSWPGMYSCNFIEQGLVAYDNKESESGKEILYVPKETIDKMLPSFIGKPVCIKHNKITPENYEELRSKGVIVGNVVKVWFNPQDGWFWCDFVVDTQKGRDRIEKEKDSVSCAYAVLDAKDGSIWHDIKYDGEVTDGEFTHLALVDSPRYEGAKITKQIPALLVNEKSAHLFNNKEDYMNLKDLLFRKKPDGSKEKLGEIVIAMNGKDVDLGEFLGTLVEKINEKHPAKTGLEGIDGARDEDMILINGVKYNVGAIRKQIKPENEKKNCNCNAKDGDMHDKECPMWEKKNEDDGPVTVDKGTPAGSTGKPYPPKPNSKEEDDKEKEEKKEKENSKRIQELEAENALLKKKEEGNKFFNELENLANSVLEPPVRDVGLPVSRQERANRKSEQVKKQFSGSAK